ncbi:N-acetylglucosamine kinase [Thalassotalea sp. PLHSN55]|uniref:N-acetylglucosamine kinase n=1 Tax=Thalassotalea sp. PLHSN55 TaxID=3435888 RepID=UPI003F83CF5E
MLNSSGKHKDIFLGIDGGGTKCKAIVVSADDQILGTGISGPGNPLHGFEQATNSIVESAQFALKDAGLANTPLSEVVVGIGLAGVNLPVLFEQMSAWQHPFKEMYLATDLLIACLGAHQGKEGAVMITGTGSCGFSYVDAKSTIVGAHGFPHGDKGSGAWFGLQAAKQVLLALDGLIEETAMSKQLLKLLAVDNDVALVEAIAGKPATYYAKLANLVFDAAENGDVIARDIVNEGSEYINSVARKLSHQKPPRMSMIGGLSPRIQPWLASDVQAMLSPPLSTPEMGAVLFAKQQIALT